MNRSTYEYVQYKMQGKSNVIVNKIKSDYIYVHHHKQTFL